jgi:hypothetical protein
MLRSWEEKREEDRGGEKKQNPKLPQSFASGAINYSLNN